MREIEMYLFTATKVSRQYLLVHLEKVGQREGKAFGVETVDMKSGEIWEG
jgi:hypothetical protein